MIEFIIILCLGIIIGMNVNKNPEKKYTGYRPKPDIPQPGNVMGKD